jgi:hypothetical protein
MSGIGNIQGRDIWTSTTQRIPNAKGIQIHIVPLYKDDTMTEFCTTVRESNRSSDSRGYTGEYRSYYPLIFSWKKRYTKISNSSTTSNSSDCDDVFPQQENDQVRKKAAEAAAKTKRSGANQTERMITFRHTRKGDNTILLCSNVYFA